MENKTLTYWKVQGSATKVTTQAKSGKQSIELAPNAVLQSSNIAIKKGRLPVQAMIEGISPSGSVTAEIKLQYLKDDTVIKDYTVANSVAASWSRNRVNGVVPADVTHVRVQVTNKGNVNLYLDDLVLEESSLETKYVYDSAGEKVKETIDPYGNKTSYTYNEYLSTDKNLVDDSRFF